MKNTLGAGGASLLAEMQEFARFDAEEQRYICRSLDVGQGRSDALKRWARDTAEARSIRDQARVYRRLDELRLLSNEAGDELFEEPIMKHLLLATAFDLAQERLASLGAFRFLYERLLGAWIRPWLVAAFCGAAALPQLHPNRRSLLLKSIDEDEATAVGWSSREPAFYPHWLDDQHPVSA